VVEVPGRGSTFVRELPAPAGAPTLVLLHGLTASADLSWFRCFDALGSRYGVVSVEHRGYGGGLPLDGPFRLHECADDVVAVAHVLGIERFVPVGYSMGGAVAQLVWRRHRRRVSGLVLCATGAFFVGTVWERAQWLGLPAWTVIVRRAPWLGRHWVGSALLSRFEESPWRGWAEAELRRAHPAHMLAAAHELGRFSSREWIGNVDVPTSVVVTAEDVLVPPARQAALAAAIPGATLHRVQADHGAPVGAADRFVPALLEACRQVTGGGT
jgi:3-oxoadipate enol-lactonase